VTISRTHGGSGRQRTLRGSPPVYQCRCQCASPAASADLIGSSAHCGMRVRFLPSPRENRAVIDELYSQAVLVYIGKVGQLDTPLLKTTLLRPSATFFVRSTYSRPV
jgi:hypothetical protein